MPYATLADLITSASSEEILQLTDDNADGIADTNIVDAAIAKADAEINALVASRFATPLQPVPELVKSYSALFAVYYLYIRRGGAPTEAVQRARTDALRLLRDIGKGLSEFGDVIPASNATASSLDVRISSKARVMSRDVMDGF